MHVGEWLHYVGTLDDERTYIYKNGVERDSDLLSGYDITPQNDTVILAEPSLVAYYRLDETSGTTAKDTKGTHDGSYHGGVELGAADWPNP